VEVDTKVDTVPVDVSGVINGETFGVGGVDITGTADNGTAFTNGEMFDVIVEGKTGIAGGLRGFTNGEIGIVFDKGMEEAIDEL